MQYPVKILRINTKKPIYICRSIDQLEIKKISDPLEQDSEYKRAFSVRLAEAVGNLVKPKKSIKNIEKPKRRKRRRRKKT